MDVFIKETCVVGRSVRKRSKKYSKDVNLMNEELFMQNCEPDYSALLQSLIDVVQEEQIKIGYRKETIRLYYPVKSVNNLLGMDGSVDELMKILQNFVANSKENLGDIIYSIENERCCFVISEAGVEYIHKNIGERSFLKDFIERISKCHCTINEIESIFKKYSESYRCEKVENGEFDYLLWFEDGKPDRYMYCIKFEGEHAIYHRFTKKDYEDFNF